MDIDRKVLFKFLKDIGFSYKTENSKKLTIVFKDLNKEYANIFIRIIIYNLLKGSYLFNSDEKKTVFYNNIFTINLNNGFFILDLIKGENVGISYDDLSNPPTNEVKELKNIIISHTISMKRLNQLKDIGL